MPRVNIPGGKQVHNARSRTSAGVMATPSGMAPGMVIRTPWERDWEARRGDARCRGKTWHDMPGGESGIQKINFFLFSRGLIDFQEQH